MKTDDGIRPGPDWARGAAPGPTQRLKLPDPPAPARPTAVDSLQGADSDRARAPGDSPPPSPSTPSPLAPKRVSKSRSPKAVPDEPAAEAAYARNFRQRLKARLAHLDLRPGDLVPQEVKASDRALSTSILRDFRVSVVSLGGTLYARTRHLALGSFGKHHVALGPDRELVAMKSLRTGDKAGVGADSQATRAVDYEAAFQEASLMQRYFHPDVELGVDARTQKLLLKTRLGVVLDAALAAPDSPKLALRRSTLRQLAAQLAQMHTDGLLHNDIKPANVFLLADGAIKLGDMGLAAAPQDIKEPGTPTFAAPELSLPLLGDNELPGSAADVWSLGLTLADTLHPIGELMGSASQFYDILNLHQDIMDWQAEVAPAGVLDMDKVRQLAAPGSISSYFLKVMEADPELGALIVSRMLAGPAARADIHEVLARARVLQPEGSAAEQEATAYTRALADGRHARALATALELRLEDHADYTPASGAAP